MTAFRVQCPTCQREVQVRHELRGQRVGCPHCQAAMLIPDIVPPPPTGEAHPMRLACPHCQGTFRASPELAGRPSECPHCQGTVLIPTKGITCTTDTPDAPILERVTRTTRDHLVDAKAIPESHPLEIENHVMTVRWKGRRREVRRLSDGEKSRRQFRRNVMFAGIGVVILVATLLLMQLR